VLCSAVCHVLGDVKSVDAANGVDLTGELRPEEPPRDAVGFPQGQLRRYVSASSPISLTPSVLCNSSIVFESGA
jgi:hypothetical protein